MEEVSDPQWPSPVKWVLVLNILSSIICLIKMSFPTKQILVSFIILPVTGSCWYNEKPDSLTANVPPLLYWSHSLPTLFLQIFSSRRKAQLSSAGLQQQKQQTSNTTLTHSLHSLKLLFNVPTKKSRQSAAHIIRTPWMTRFAQLYFCDKKGFVLGPSVLFSIPFKVWSLLGPPSRRPGLHPAGAGSACGPRHVRPGRGLPRHRPQLQRKSELFLYIYTGLQKPSWQLSWGNAKFNHVWIH